MENIFRMSLLRSQFKRIVISQATPAVRCASYSFSPVQRMKEENEVAKRKVRVWQNFSESNKFPSEIGLAKSKTGYY